MSSVCCCLLSCVQSAGLLSGCWRRSRDAKCCKRGQSSVVFVLCAVTGWWSKMTVTWWRADSSLAWCWCLWPAREVTFVSTDQTWRSCGSPSNRPTTRSSTAGLTSGFHSGSTVFFWFSFIWQCRETWHTGKEITPLQLVTEKVCTKIKIQSLSTHNPEKWRVRWSFVVHKTFLEL